MKAKKSVATSSLAEFDLHPVEPRWKRILVPLDFTESSVKALDYAIPLARRSGGKLVLLHVVQFPVMPMPAVTGGAIGQVKEAHKALTQEAGVRLNALAKKAGANGLVSHTFVTTGTAWNEIVKAAKRLKCDLVVISSRSHKGIMQILASHTAEHVVRMAPCSTLCIRG